MGSKYAITFDSDQAMPVHGVPGRLTHRTVRQPGELAVWCNQKWISEARPIDGYGTGAALRVELRFDDECRNGHNTFAITAEVRRPKARDIEAGGCMHEEIARIFPELEPLIKWHLVSSDSPMHYVANAVYHAGDRDYRGLRKGEVRQLRNGRTGVPCWRLVAMQDGAPVEVPRGFVESAECPTTVPLLLWEPYNIVGEGKDRDLDAARSCAVWPEATDAELSVEPEQLRAVLAARLPALQAAFQAAMLGAGFVWAPADMPAQVQA